MPSMRDTHKRIEKRLKKMEEEMPYKEEYMEQAKAAAEQVARLINNFSDDPAKAFVEAMGSQHRTLQQNFMGLVCGWIQMNADRYARGQYDLRNEATCQLCARIKESLETCGYELYKLPTV